MRNYNRRELAEKISEYWVEGQRHYLALGIAGALRKQGWKREEVRELISNVCDLAGDEEKQDRLKAVDDTFHKDSEKIAGFSILPPEIADILRKGSESKKKTGKNPRTLSQIEKVCKESEKNLRNLVEIFRTTEKFSDFHRKLFRGLARDFDELINIIDEYHLGIFPDRLVNEFPALEGRMIIPYQNEEGFFIWYNARDLIGRTPRYLSPSGSKQPYILPGEEETVYIVEGEFNAITLRESFKYRGDPIPRIFGFSGNGGVEAVIDYIKANFKNLPDIFVITDNDEAGRRFYRTIQEAFKKAKRLVLKDSRDLNEILMDEGMGAVIKALEEAEVESFARITSAGDYLEVLRRLYEQRQRTREYKTGFSFIDKDGISNHLIVFGGAPGVGKTTLAINMALNLLESSEDVIVYYVSYEMEEEALKARLFFTRYNMELLERGKDPLLQKVLFEKTKEEFESIISEKDFSEEFERFRIIDAKGKLFKIDEIIDFITEDAPPDSFPVVFIDYLQLIYEDEGGSSKERIDSILRKLILLREKAPIFAISSVNRASYSEINMASFKESGGIEYSADRLFGIMFEEGSDAPDDPYSQLAKTVKITPLKNRYGNTGGCYLLNFYTTYGVFKDAGEGGSQCASKS